MGAGATETADASGYFGNDHYAEHAPGMKTIDDALEMPGRLTTVLHWTHSFVGRGRAERVTTAQQLLARSALERARESAGPPTSP